MSKRDSGSRWRGRDGRFQSPPDGMGLWYHLSPRADLMHLAPGSCVASSRAGCVLALAQTGRLTPECKFLYIVASCRAPDRPGVEFDSCLVQEATFDQRVSVTPLGPMNIDQLLPLVAPLPTRVWREMSRRTQNAMLRAQLKAVEQALLDTR